MTIHHIVYDKSSDHVTHNCYAILLESESEVVIRDTRPTIGGFIILSKSPKSPHMQINVPFDCKSDNVFLFSDQPLDKAIEQILEFSKTPIKLEEDHY